MIERPTSRGTGVEARVRSFDADAARRLLVELPDLVEGPLEVDEKVRRIQEHVRLEVAIGWRLIAESLDGVRAVAVPEALRQD